jgi:hypothetical protein
MTLSLTLVNSTNSSCAPPGSRGRVHRQVRALDDPRIQVRQKQSEGIECSSKRASRCPLRKVRAAFANAPLAANIPGFRRGPDQRCGLWFTVDATETSHSLTAVRGRSLFVVASRKRAVPAVGHGKAPRFATARTPRKSLGAAPVTAWAGNRQPPPT